MTRAIILFLIATAVQAMTPERGKVDYIRTIPSVREFTKSRNFFAKLVNWVAGPAEDKPELIRPYATTHDSIGRLLIADPGQRGIHIYDFEKHKYQFLKGSRGRDFISPIDVACDANDNIYVSDSVRALVYVFDSRGRFQRAIGGSKQGDARLLRPTGMFLDRATRRLYLTDTLRHQVLVFGLDGTLIRAIGKRGNGPGRVQLPHRASRSRPENSTSSTP